MGGGGGGEELEVGGGEHGTIVDYMGRRAGLRVTVEIGTKQGYASECFGSR